MKGFLLPIPISFVVSACGSGLVVQPGTGTKESIVDRVTPLIAAPNAVISVYGKELKKDLQLEIGGTSVSFSSIGPRRAQFLLPSTLNPGLQKIRILRDEEVVQELNIYLSEDGKEFPLSEVSASATCKGTLFRSVSGRLLEGEKECSTEVVLAESDCETSGQTGCLATASHPAVSLADLQASKDKILSGLTLLDIQGTIPDCGDAASACFMPAGTTLKASNVNLITPEDLKIGTTVAGVVGNRAPLPPDCSADNETSCVATTNFPAAKKADIDASKYMATLSIAGIPGSMSSCAALGSACYLGAYNSSTQKFKAIDFASITPDIIKLNEVIAGVTGTLSLTPATCALDGATACLTDSNYPSVQKAAVTAAKVHSSLTLAGQAGAMNDCAADAAISCFSVGSFPAVQKSLLSSETMRSGLTLGGVSGNVPDCGAQGSACYVPAYVASTQPYKAINFDGISNSVIKSGSTIAGITGNVVQIPANCATDGSSNCLAVTNYPAVNKSNLNTNKDKLHSTLSFASITGTMGNCAADAQESCKAVTAFPALGKAAFDAGKSKVHSTLTIGSVAGAMNDCVAENTTGCFTVTDYPAIDRQNYDTNKALALTTFSAVGVSGTLAACAANASNCYVGPYVLTTQPLKAINYDTIDAATIKDGASIAGVDGTMLEKPANCGADAGEDCVAVANYPAVQKSSVNTNKAKFPTTLTVAGIAGTMPDCSADAQLGCYSVTNFPAADKQGLDSNKAKYLTTLTLAGVAGTMSSCAANGTACFLPTYATVAQPLKAINYSSITANVIKDQVQISDVTGNVIEAPAACNSNGGTNCVAGTNYPAFNLSNADTNKAKFHSSLSAGSVTGEMSDCSGDNGVGCFTVTDYPAVDKASMNTNKASVHTSLTIAGIQGTLASCAANGSNCYLPSYVLTTQPLKAISYDSLDANNIKFGTTISDIPGNLLQAPANCNADNGTDCVTVTDYPAVNATALDAAKAKALPTLTAAGVTGTLANCNSEGGTDCYATATYPSFVKNTIDTNKSLISSTLSTGGITGTLASCGAQGSNCFLPAYVLTTQPLKAINFDSITAGVIKKNTTIAGILGDYPSSTYPMAAGDGLSDLQSGTFNSQLTSNTGFGYYDRNGTRYTGAGSSDIDTDKLADNVSIFGITGSMKALNLWDVRAGTSYSTASSGRLKANCRNLADLSRWDAGKGFTASLADTGDLVTTSSNHGWSNNQRVRLGWHSGASVGTQDVVDYHIINATANTFQVSLTSGGAAVAVTGNNTNATAFRSLDGIAGPYDTIEPYSDNNAFPTTNPWSVAGTECHGFESVADDNNVWKDVTTGGCSSGASQCRMKDKITNLEWSEIIDSGTFGVAIAKCGASTHDGKSDWRMPTMYEVQEAIRHGFRSTMSNSNFIDQNHFTWTLWTASKVSNNSATGYRIHIGSGQTGVNNQSAVLGFVCVRTAD